MASVVMLLSGCVTVGWTSAEHRDPLDEFWLVRQRTVPAPIPEPFKIVLESRIFYCPVVESERGHRLEACYEAEVPEKFRK